MSVILNAEEEKEQLLRLISGDVDAFDRIYWKYQHAVYRNALKLARGESEAEDILQEVFISLWEKREAIDPTRSVAGWLFVASYNRSVNVLKKKLRESLAIDNLSFEETDQEAKSESEIVSLQINLLNEAISKLPKQKRRVFELCKLQGKTYEEAAHEMNISKHTVKEYLSEAIHFIKEYANQHRIISVAITFDLVSGFFKAL